MADSHEIIHHLPTSGSGTLSEEFELELDIDNLEEDFSQAMVLPKSRPETTLLLPSGLLEDGGPTKEKQVPQPDQTSKKLVRSYKPSETANSFTRQPGKSGKEVLEPVLEPLAEDTAFRAANADNDPALLGGPIFFSRLRPAKPVDVEAENIWPNVWQVTQPSGWPIFVMRLSLPRPVLAGMVKDLGRIAAHWAGNRLRLIPEGDVELVFNDRADMENARRELTEAGFDLNPAALPVKITHCRGLLLCPFAVINTLQLAATLNNQLAGLALPQGRRQPVLAIAGCQAGHGFNCGLTGQADLTLIPGRTRLPVIDQESIIPSAQLTDIVNNCPGRALSLFKNENQALSLVFEDDKCVKCGYCAAHESDIFFEEPAGGYIDLYVHEPVCLEENFNRQWLKPQLLRPSLPLGQPDWFDVVKAVREIIAGWLTHSSGSESLAAFALSQVNQEGPQKKITW